MKRMIAILPFFLGLAACLPTIDIPQRVAVVDGAIFVNFCRAGVNWSFDGPNKCALMVSEDRGKTWRNHRIDGLTDFAFADRKRGLLLIAAEVHRTDDGGATHAPAPEFERPVTGILAARTASFVLAQNASYLSRDAGRSEWERIDLPDMGERVGLVAAAAGPESLAVASSVGRVYIRSEEGWREWIVGGVHDLTYSDGLYYAATQMRTVAVLDGQSIRHLPLKPSYAPTGFLSTEGSVYLWSGPQGLHKVAAGVLTPVQGPSIGSEDRLFHAKVALLNPRELVAFSGTQSGLELEILSPDSQALKVVLPSLDF